MRGYEERFLSKIMVELKNLINKDVKDEGNIYLNIMNNIVVELRFGNYEILLNKYEDTRYIKNRYGWEELNKESLKIAANDIVEEENGKKKFLSGLQIGKNEIEFIEEEEDLEKTIKIRGF